MAEQYSFQFILFVFFHNRQIHADTASFVCSQIDRKLRSADGQTKAAKKKAIWKLWVRNISAAMNRAASRNT